MKATTQFVITVSLSVLLAVLSRANVLDFSSDRFQDERESFDIQTQVLLELTEVMKELRDSLRTRETVRYECRWPFNFFANNCYHVAGGTSTRTLAREFCWALNSDLATFKDINDLKLIIGYLNLMDIRSFWIGGSRHNSSYDFQWLDGTDLPDTSLPIWKYQRDHRKNCVLLSKSQNPRGISTYYLKNADCDENRESWGIGSICRL